MEVHGIGDQREFYLSNGDEIDTVRLATHRRARRISPLDLGRRKLKHDLQAFTHELSATLASAESPRAESTRLDHVRSELALGAMKWVLQYDNFEPNYFGRDLEELVVTAESGMRAA